MEIGRGSGEGSEKIGEGSVVGTKGSGSAPAMSPWLESRPVFIWFDAFAMKKNRLAIKQN
jgi:hypothetical protein